MRVLVTGSYGYIGRVLMNHLISYGHQVLGHDLPHNDIRKVNVFFREAIDNVEAIIHLASISNNDYIEAHPLEAKSINEDCLPAILEAIDGKRFIYASSVAAYGNIEGEAEEDHPLNPTTAYGKSKRFCENLMNGKHLITRAATVCGPSPALRTDTTLNKMVHDALTKGVITVHGGAQVRSFIHIKDLCEFYRLLLRSPVSGVFNVVDVNWRIKDVAELVSDVTGAKIEYKERADDRSYAVSGKKAKEVFGFWPQWTLEDAIKEVCENYRAG